MSKQAICNAIRVFISQRSGIDPREYGTGKEARECFLGDYRPMLRHGRHARQLLRYVEMRPSITAEMLMDASERAFSGRLRLVEKGDKVGVDYCEGQYFPTEYRNAACAVLARAICTWLAGGNHDAHDIRAEAKREFGRAIASAWFN